MKSFLNFSKTYWLNKPYDEVFNRLDSIASLPFTKSNYSIYGNLVSPNPVEFIFRAKGLSLFQPVFTIAVTKISVILFEEGDKTRLTVNTLTNFTWFIVLFIIAALFIGTLAAFIFTGNNWWLPLIYLLQEGFILFIDRMSKNILVGSFERDCLSFN